VADIVLSFATEGVEDASSAFESVGESAESMGSEVEESSGAFDSIADGASGLRGPTRGLASTFRGVNGTMDGFSKLAQGDVMGGLQSMAMGVSGLVRGLTTFLIPALSATVGWLRTTRLATIAHAVSSGIASAATKVWSVIQGIFNVIMALNPVVLIIAAILILIGVIVLIATKTDWFQRLWHAIWKIIDQPVKAVWGWIKNTLWPGIQRVWEGIVAGAKMVWRGISTYFGFWKGILDKVMRWVGDIPGRIRRAFSGLGNAISAPFRAGFDAVKSFWNNTIGGKGFTIPSWVPGVGGNSFRFPVFHQGGIVPGAPGQEVLAILQAGERITPAGGSSSRSLGPQHLTPAAGSALERMFLAWLQDAMRRNNLRIVAG
jgi:phage-related protein